jgi:hypothetical protein
MPARDPFGCDEARAAVCRLAAGGSLGEQALRVARHVRGCAACDHFVDELAELRRWLERLPHPSGHRPSTSRLRAEAVVALARELQARLARDLLALGQGRRPRARAVIELDLARLEALRGAAVSRHGPWRAAAEVLLDGAEAKREQLFELAARLDPLGLDVALGWLGQLVRTGDAGRARATAERLLTEVH